MFEILLKTNKIKMRNIKKIYSNFLNKNKNFKYLFKAINDQILAQYLFDHL